MSPSARVQIVLGALATATVAFLSYFVVKRRAVHGKRSSVHHEGVSREHIEGGDTSPLSEKFVSETTVSQSSQSSQLEETYSEQESHLTGGTDRSSGGYEKSKDFLNDGQDQTSYIVIGNGEESVPPDTDYKDKKKSDRSSDESSYDVIDDDLVEEGTESSEKDEGGHALDDGSQQKPPEQDTFLDSNETSMVIIEDLDHSGVSKSESSFYASADEQLERLEELEVGEEKQKNVGLVYVPEEDLSITETDTISSAPSGVDVSSLHDENEVEDGQTAEVHTHLDQSEVLASADDPVIPSEQLLTESSTVQDGEQISSTVITSEQDITSTEDVVLDVGDVTEVLNVCQTSPSTISKENIHRLVELLRRRIPELHSTVLNCVLRVAAFTQNIKTLRESGCLRVVADQVQEACKTVAEGELEAEMLLNSLCQIMTNLTLDPKCQTEFEDTVPSLINLLLSSDKESIQLSVLRPLINFSSQPSFHHHFTRAVQNLYTVLDTGSHIAKVQSIRVLVNLSLSESMVTHMLAAKAPAKLLELLDLPTSTDLILRTLTMLANIKMAVQKGNVSLASLPVEDKAASPETMYMALHGVNSIPTLRSKVFRLTRHNDEDVSHQASKLYQYIQQTSE